MTLQVQEGLHVLWVLSVCLSQLSSVASCGISDESLNLSIKELRAEEEGDEKYVLGNGKKVLAEHPLQELQRCVWTALVETSLYFLANTFGKQLVPILRMDWDTEARKDSMWRIILFSIYAGLQQNLIEVVAFLIPFDYFFFLQEILKSEV